jgi:surface antigen
MLTSLRRKTRRLGAAALVGGVALGTAFTGTAAPPAAAQQPPQQQPQQQSPAQEHETFGTDNGTCDRSALSQVLSTSRGNLLGSAAGAAAGGLLGSQIGKGGGNTAATIAGILSGALAGGSIGRQMEPADHGCVGRTLENAPTNQTVTWNNPDKDAHYSVTPTRTFDGRDGQPCRDYVTEAEIGGKREQETRTACRQSDGTWTMQTAAAAGTQPPPAASPPPSPGGAAERTDQGVATAPPAASPGYEGIGSQTAAAASAAGGRQDYSRLSDQELREQLSTVEDQQRQLDLDRRAIEEELDRRGARSVGGSQR